MLIEFRVANYLSFKEQQTLSLVASSDKTLPGNTFPIPGKPGMSALRSVAVYGANASGKSNLVTAMRFMKEFVEGSARAGQRGDPISATPFKLESRTAQDPSEFEMTFMVGEQRYVYGFQVDRQRVHGEWLTVAHPRRRPACLFRRQADGEILFGELWRGERVRLRAVTRDNALFLSVAAQFNNEVVRPAFDWFRRSLRVIPDRDAEDELFELHRTCELAESPRFRSWAKQFLQVADVGIADFVVSRVPPTESAGFGTRSEGARSSRMAWTSEILQSSDMPVVHTVHSAGDGSPVLFDLESEESAGTTRLFSLAGTWYEALSQDGVLLVDELDTSLHPLLTRFLLTALRSGDTAQLVFTTHDSSLLDTDLLRRDQVWLVEKDPGTGTTRLYSLWDYHIRKDENVQKGYLRGRYGAIPFIGQFPFGERDAA